jgi:hypothetical protein
MRSCLLDKVQLDCQYDLARVTRECALKSQASRYELAFERAFAKREAQRKEDTRQWKDVILPRIKTEAAMRRYERGM